MRAKGPIRVLVLLLAVSLLPTMVVLAHHGPAAEDVVTVATANPWFMDCSQVSPRCIEQPGSKYPTRKAWIQPSTGALTRVTIQVEGIYINTEFPWHFGDQDQLWAEALHNVGCDNASAVAAFIDKVAALQPAGTSVEPEVVGECSMLGLHVAPGTSRTFCLGAEVDCFVVQSDILASAASPTPTPTPTATPKPTATPTPTPTPTATALPATATPRATATATAATSESASALASASASASQTESASSSESPEQTVAGITFSPGPSVPAEAPNEGVGGWPGSVPGTGEISGKPANVAGSALAAILLLAVMGFIGELFNNTMETNYDRIMGWWKKSWLGRIGRGLSSMLGGGAK